MSKSILNFLKIFIAVIFCLYFMLFLFNISRKYFHILDIDSSAYTEIINFSWNLFFINLITSLIITLFAYIFIIILLMSLYFIGLINHKKFYEYTNKLFIVTTISWILLSFIISFNSEQLSLLATIVSLSAIVSPFLKTLKSDIN